MARSPSSLKRHRFTISGVELSVYDQLESIAAETVAHELVADQYGIGAVRFRDGDSVVDVGAHVGLFSIWMAKRFPSVRLFAYEPFPENFECLRRNLVLNDARNVSAFRTAITRDGRSVSMATNPTNSGGASSFATTLTHHRVDDIPSTTLEQAFRVHGIDRCRLLKLDCEGAEYEILLGTNVLSRVDYLAVECHTNAHLRERGWTFEELERHCRLRVAEHRATLSLCTMSE